jgi:hypothetical protein
MASRWGSDPVSIGEIDKSRASCFDRFADARNLMRGETIHDHYVPALERRSQTAFDISQERPSGRLPPRAPLSSRAMTLPRISAEYAFGIVRPPEKRINADRLTHPQAPGNPDSIGPEHALEVREPNNRQQIIAGTRSLAGQRC